MELTSNMEKSKSCLSSGNSRLEYIDVCKAIGIILVILGHTNVPDKCHMLIYSFHMPLFFIISGFLYSKEKNEGLGFKRFFIKKCKQYLIPYVLFALINLAAQCLWKLVLLKEGLSIDYILENLKGIFFCYSDMRYMPNCSPIWFLLCLFISSVIFFWIMKIDFKFSWIPTLLFALISYCLSPYCVDYNSFPWKFPVFLMAAFLMYCGYCFRIIVDKSEKIRTKNLSVSIIAVLIIIGCFALVILTDNWVEMNKNQYGNLFVFLITSDLTSISVILLCDKIHILQNKFFLWLGKNTIYIVGFNYLFRDIATEIYYLIPVVNNYEMEWYSHFALTLLISIAGTYICDKIRLAFNYCVKRIKKSA